MDSEGITDLFNRALKFTLRFEGGYVNDPDDRGGATNKGITQNTYDQWNVANDLPMSDVKTITDKEVHRIYRMQYWAVGKCSAISNYDQSLAVVHFDACVNHGVKQAAKFLQRAIGVKADGVIGAKTIDRLARTQSNVVRNYMEQRRAFYRHITTKRAANTKFLSGWLRRADELLDYVEPRSTLCADLQKFLKDHDLDCGRIDNIAGRRTESAALLMMERIFGKIYREVS